MDFYLLHDKATRGEPLSTEEEVELAAWYAGQDTEEAALLSSFSRPSLTADALRAEIGDTLTRLQATAQQVRKQVEENEALRQEIAALTRQLAQTKTLQSA